jgi:hypothetical protein
MSKKRDRDPPDFKEALSRVPWGSRGRDTPIARLARSIVPVGNKSGVPKGDLSLSLPIQAPEHEDWVMDIAGTAFQVGRGKLMTAWHVAEDLRLEAGEAYLYGNSRLDGIEAHRPYPVIARLRFYDVRFDDGGPGVDAGVLLSPAVSTEAAPYDVPLVSWGDSTRVGVGDRVFIGGFPLGKDMFFSNTSNRGLLQPSFFDGIVSAVIPAIHPGETRLFQISSMALSGISGGVVCDPRNGAVLGMVTSGLEIDGVKLPITYAIPSEVLRPFADALMRPMGSAGASAKLPYPLQACACLCPRERPNYAHGNDSRHHGAQNAQGRRPWPQCGNRTVRARARCGQEGHGVSAADQGGGPDRFIQSEVTGDGGWGVERRRLHQLPVRRRLRADLPGADLHGDGVRVQAALGPRAG